MKSFTSASANKYLRALEDEKAHLLARERETCIYTLAVGEQGDPPAYDYDEVRVKVEEIDNEVRAIRHALHSFNATETLPGSDITIDEALILLAQLNNRKTLLGGMRKHQAKERVSDRFYRGDAIEYRYANYDVAKAETDYVRVAEQVGKLQLEIDLANQTRTFEVDV